MIGTIEGIYRQHRKGLFTLALSITRQEASAEDAVHEAIVRLCRGDKSPAGDAVAYVYAAVRNAAIDQKRSKVSVSIFDLPQPSREAGFVDPDRNQMIADALDELAPDQREAVVMHLYTGLTFQQSAEVLQLPLQTIASRYRRAIAKLKEQLASLR